MVIQPYSSLARRWALVDLDIVRPEAVFAHAQFARPHVALIHAPAENRNELIVRRLGDEPWTMIAAATRAADKITRVTGI
jgi:hypothetical protein